MAVEHASTAINDGFGDRRRGGDSHLRKMSFPISKRISNQNALHLVKRRFLGAAFVKPRRGCRGRVRHPGGPFERAAVLQACAPSTFSLRPRSMNPPPLIQTRFVLGSCRKSRHGTGHSVPAFTLWETDLHIASLFTITAPIVLPQIAWRNWLAPVGDPSGAPASNGGIDGQDLTLRVCCPPVCDVRAGLDRRRLRVNFVRPAPF